MITKRGRRLQRYDLQLIMCGDIVKDSNSYLKSRGSIKDFVSFREMITSQLQGKLWLYDEVRTQDNINAGNSEIEAESAQDYFVMPIWSSYTSTVKSSKAKNKGEKPTKNTDLKTNEKPVDQEDQAFLDELERAARASSTNTVNTVSTQVSTVSSALVLPGLKVTHKYDGIFISQDKYVDEILKKFGFSTVKTTSTPMETSKPLLKDVEAEDVDVHLYRSMIRSLIFQVTPKVSHLYAVKRIFRYLKGQLGLWYPKDSPFDLEAYTDSDYAGANLDRKSTTGGCQFLRSGLISWQCKKQTIVANSTTEVEYVAASNCCGQVLWIQNQLLDYGYNFMNTKIFIDTESTICIVKNPVFHSKIKHIEIRHHFIRDSYKKRLIQVIKINTDHNVADLLTKAVDVREVTYVKMQWIIHKGWLEWSAKAAKDEIEAKVSAARLLTTAMLLLELQLLRLEKSTKHVDFDEIVDFLNASPIRYALTVSPTIYVSYIEQFWSTTKIKIVNNERQIRAKVDGKTIVISESSVKRDLQFNDEDGTITPLFATMLIQPQAVEGEGSGQPTEPQHTPTTASPSNIEPIPIIASSSHPKKTHKRRKTKRKATEISQSSGPTTLVANETVHEERGDSMERAVTTAASLDAEQDSEESQEVGKEEEGKNSTTQEEGRNTAESDQDEEISFVQKDAETRGRYDHDIDVTTANTPITTVGVSDSTAEPSTPPTTTILIENKDLIIAQTLMKIKSEKSKEKLKEKGVSSETALRPTRGVTIQESSESRTRQPIPPPQHDLKDKVKAKMIEPEKPSNKKDQIKLDEEMAKRLAEELEAELEEEEKLAKQREEEANLIS
ncbi:hypothetical protein Tco_1016793 [Tanacetum coccineum]|uniref:Uncharacterized protein n=1 Tax=Tanacetum coccineum TaxID=301880 RepID=A0ABQ5FR13_9ASTR